MTFSTEQVADAAGLSYRRLDHYVRAGYVPGAALPGSGHERTFTLDQAVKVATIAELVRAGFTVRLAAHHAWNDGGEFESAHTQTRVDIEAITEQTKERLHAIDR